MMLGKKHWLLAFFFLLASSLSLFAQEEGNTESESKSESESEETEKASDEYPYPAFRSEEYKEFVPKRRQDQQDKFLDRKYNYPAKPRDKWEIGLDAGLLMVSGDIKTGFTDWKAGDKFHTKLGFGGHIRRSFGYVFSLRGNFMMGSTWGRNWQAAQGWSFSSIDPTYHPNGALAGSSRYDEYNEDGPTPNYIDPATNTGRNVFYNYKTNIRELSISGVFNIHNIRFHKRETKIGLYGLAGIGGVAYRTMMDQLDADGNTYADRYQALVSSDIYNGNYDMRKDVLAELDNIVDGEFESQAERHFDDYTPFDKYSYKPTAHAGVGLAFKLGRVVNLALESRVTYTNDDLLDGQRWQEWGALTRDYDTYVFTGLGLNFNLGSKNSVEPLWWMNPLDYTYEELAEAPCCENLDLPDFKDDDKDGVPNAWDEEPDSRENCPVDTRGRMLDSDRDGVLDCDDREPHTRYDAIDLVDQYGVAPKVKIKCDDIDGFCDCVKKCSPPVVAKADPCANPLLPSILFDLNKYSIKPAFDAQLAEVARFLRDCPNTTLCVIGHTDVRHSDPYNDVLSYKRAKEVVEKLVKDYGIARTRLVIQYRGEVEPVVSGLSDSPVRKAIDADHALNRRVEFRVCPPQNDMPKPSGPSDAGSRIPKP